MPEATQLDRDRAGSFAPCPKLLAQRESSLIHGFTFHGSSYPRSTAVHKHYMENSRNKLRTVQSGALTSYVVSLRPTWDVIPSVSPHCGRSLLVSHLADTSVWSLSRDRGVCAHGTLL